MYCVVPCSEFPLISFREYKLKVGEREVTLKSDMVPVKRHTKREGGGHQVRHGSCQETHKERGRSPSSQTWFLSRDTQREREVALKSDMVPVKRYTKREGGHPQVRHGSCYTKREGGDPQVRHGSCQETHKERGRWPSSQTWFLSRDTQREREVALKSDMVPVKRYTKREGGHPQVRHGSCYTKREGGDPQVRHGSCQEIHKERGR